MTAKFEDGKDDGALRTIGEVSRAVGVKTHVLRYWEQQFPMLQPMKRSGNRRYYRAADVALIERIDRLVNRDGYTLKGAQQAIESDPGDGMAKTPKSLQDSGGDQPQEIASQTRPTHSEIRSRLQDLRNRLAAAAVD